TFQKPVEPTGDMEDRRLHPTMFRRACHINRIPVRIVRGVLMPNLPMTSIFLGLRYERGSIECRCHVRVGVRVKCLHRLQDCLGALPELHPPLLPCLPCRVAQGPSKPKSELQRTTAVGPRSITIRAT